MAKKQKSQGEVNPEVGELQKPEKEKKLKPAKDLEQKPEKAEKPAKASKAGRMAEKKGGKKKGLKPGKSEKKTTTKHQGITSIGIDYSRAPGLVEDHFMFLDETGRLCFSAQGTVSFVSLIPQSEVELEEDCQ